MYQGETEGVSPRAAGLRLAGLGRLGSNILQRATGLWGSNKKEVRMQLSYMLSILVYLYLGEVDSYFGVRW